MSNTTQTIVQGPAGNLEVMLSEPSSNIDGVAVLCHPHPLYGGSMHDSVLNIAASALLQQHIAVARFNFRGVGNSQGISGRSTQQEKSLQSYEPPEVGDLLAVAQWAQAHFSLSRLICAGYCVGSHVLWQTLSQINCDKALLIAPPSAVMRYAEQDVTSSTSVHVVWCQGDDLVDPTPFTSNQSIVTTELTEGDHFFTGHAANLAGAVSSMLG